VDWIGLALERGKLRALVNAAMNLQVLRIAVKLSSGYTTGGFSSSGRFHGVG
jgi:hypothetical protein